MANSSSSASSPLASASRVGVQVLRAVHDPVRTINAVIADIPALDSTQRGEVLARAEVLVALLRGEAQKNARTWEWPLRDLSPEVFALFCSHMSDASALGTLASCSAWLRDTVSHPDFFSARCQLRHGGRVPSDGCVFVPPPANVPARLRPFFEQSLDFSRGTEPKGVTLVTQLALRFCREDRLFYSDLPKEVSTGAFTYDAGPWPAAFALQVCRVGAVDSLGFGVRTLEPIKAGQYVCSYWGEYECDESHDVTYILHEPQVPDRAHVLFGDSGACDSGVAVEDLEYEIHWDEEEEVPRCALCGSEDDHVYKERFLIDATRRGNVSRWINHSSEDANLEARLSAGSAATDGRHRVSFYATTDLGAGDLLWWDYMFRSRGRRVAARKQAPVSGGIPGPGHPFHIFDAEMLRDVTDDTPVRAEWFAEEGGKLHEGYATIDAMMVEGHPPLMRMIPIAPPLHRPPGHFPRHQYSTPEGWAEETAREFCEAYPYLFPRRLRPLPRDRPWVHGEEVEAPSLPTDPERCAYWPALRRYQRRPAEPSTAAASATQATPKGAGKRKLRSAAK
jgi:hypothetical protein